MDPKLLLVVVAIAMPFVLYGLFVLISKTRTGKAKPSGAPVIRQTEPSLSGDVPVVAEVSLDGQQDGDELEPEQVVTPPAIAEEGNRTKAAVQQEKATGNATADLGVAAKMPMAPDTDVLGDVNVVPVVTGVVAQAEDIPRLSEDILNEYYYYTVRATIDKGLVGAAALQMATELIHKSGLERYQVILCQEKETSKWEKPRPDKSYHHLVWAVPLCSRTNTITGQEMANVVRVIQDHMRKVGGVARFPSHLEIQDRLAKVTEFCEAVDCKMILALLARKEDGGQPQKCGDIIELAKHEKMEEVDGHLVRMSNGEVWYTLDGGTGEHLGRKSPERCIAKLVLCMDLPLVSQPEEAFDEMYGVARKMGRVLGFSMADEDNVAIDDAVAHEVREYVAQTCTYMREKGVRPGSKLARSLFT